MASRSMQKPRKVPSLAELRDKLHDKLPADQKPAPVQQDQLLSTEHIGRLHLPRRPSLSVLRSDHSTASSRSNSEAGSPLPPHAELPTPTAAEMPSSAPRQEPVSAQAPKEHQLQIPSGGPKPAANTAPAEAPKEHRLQTRWSLYADSKCGPASSKHDKAYTLQRIDSFATAERFARLFNHLKRPSKLPDKANVALFKEDIQPVWEAPENAGGSMWTVFCPTSSQHAIDFLFFEAALILVGAQLDLVDSILCGIDGFKVINRRYRGDRVQFWMKQTDVNQTKALASALQAKLQVSEQLGYRFEFKAHETSAKHAPTSPTAINFKPPAVRAPLNRSATAPVLHPSSNQHYHHHQHHQHPHTDNKPALGFSAFAHALPAHSQQPRRAHSPPTYRRPLS